jgi:hypothetical protein
MCRISCVLLRSAPSESPSAYCEMYRATSRCSYLYVGLLFLQAKHSDNRTSSPILKSSYAIGRDIWHLVRSLRNGHLVV